MSTTETFGRPADPIITEDAVLDLCDFSSLEEPVTLDQDVQGYRAAREQVDFETYFLTLGGLSGHAVQVTCLPNAAAQWVTFGPVDPDTGNLPEAHDGVRHDSLTEACAWAVRTLNTARYRWAFAVDTIRSYFPWATHVSLSDEDNSLSLIRVHVDNDTQGCGWECGDETSSFSQQGGEWAVDELLTSAYWAGLDPVASGWTASTDPVFRRLLLVDLSAPVATAPHPA